MKMQTEIEAKKQILLHKIHMVNTALEAAEDILKARLQK